ncbi:UNVERIFIED_CONTAM: hypothetical protein K2H54_044888 [Gekko kuhli]
MFWKLTKEKKMLHHLECTSSLSLPSWLIIYIQLQKDALTQITGSFLQNFAYQQLSVWPNIKIVQHVVDVSLCILEDLVYNSNYQDVNPGQPFGIQAMFRNSCY